jgi:hypothetical protein
MSATYHLGWWLFFVGVFFFNRASCDITSMYDVLKGCKPFQ